MYTNFSELMSCIWTFLDECLLARNISCLFLFVCICIVCLSVCLFTYLTKPTPTHHKVKSRRILQNKPYNSPSNNLYIDYNTLSLPDLHIYQISLFVDKFTYHKHRLPGIFSNYFRWNNIVHAHDTRRSNDIHVTAVNNNYDRGSITHKASTLWTNLPAALKEYSSINKFSKKN